AFQNSIIQGRGPVPSLPYRPRVSLLALAWTFRRAGRVAAAATSITWPATATGCDSPVIHFQATFADSKMPAWAPSEAAHIFSVTMFCVSVRDFLLPKPVASAAIIGRRAEIVAMEAVCTSQNSNHEFIRRLCREKRSFIQENLPGFGAS